VNRTIQHHFDEHTNKDLSTKRTNYGATIDDDWRERHNNKPLIVRRKKVNKLNNFTGN